MNLHFPAGKCSDIEISQSFWANDFIGLLVENKLGFRVLFSRLSRLCPVLKKKTEKTRIYISKFAKIRYILNSLVGRVEKLPSLSQKLKFPSMSKTLGAVIPTRRVLLKSNFKTRTSF